MSWEPSTYDGWVVLAFDAIDGRMSALPWDDAELRLVLAAQSTTWAPQ
jgi:hypothetical protein